ncbi:MAG: hypothetical protein WCA46_28690 [Actinocatenispora sp.]
MTWYGSANPEPGPHEQRDPDQTRVVGYRGEPPRRQPHFDPTRLWTGGAVTALIAAGFAVVGFLVVRGVLRMPIMGVHASGDVFAPTMIGYTIGAAVAALLATGVMHLLLVGTPRPLFYFSWIGALCTAILVLLPMGVHQVWYRVLPTALVDLVIGIAITVIVRGTAAASMSQPRRGMPPSL